MVYYDFVEIGVYNSISKVFDKNSLGLSIDILRYNLDKVIDTKGVKRLHCNISNNNGKTRVYYIHPETIWKYNLPGWLMACFSTDNLHLAVANYIKDNKLPPRRYSYYR